MFLTARAPEPTIDPCVADIQMLIEEARRRRRGRWARRLLVGVVLLGLAAAVALLTISGARSPLASGGDATAGALPNGSLAALRVAGPLAVAPDGALYVADAAAVESPGVRVLVRLSDGRFRVVAGSGTVGFSGDGGPAVRAELSSVSDLAFATNGTLYIADVGRVRAVSREGVIRTIAGDGRPLRRIASGTPALSAALGSPLHIALSPSGHLYISTGSRSDDAGQILRLTAAGRLDVVRAVITSGRGRGLPVGGSSPIAVDAQGIIDVGGGPAGWGIWQLAPNGVAHLASGARVSQGNGGADSILEPGPGGAIYAAGPAVFRVEPHKLVSIAAFNRPLSRPLRGQAFAPRYIAFSPNGTLYTDDEPGGTAFEAHQQLLSTSNARVNLLWQQTNHTPK